jgi:hypothetical protein
MKGIIEFFFFEEQDDWQGYSTIQSQREVHHDDKVLYV